MKLLAISLLLFFPTLSHADIKISVILNKSGRSSGGGFGRVKVAEVEITKDKPIGEKAQPIPVKEQITALRQHLAYLTLMEKHGVDLTKEVTANYKKVPLADVLRELIPDVPVKFDGVDAKETVKSMELSEAPMAKVIEYLDKAAGVYFDFTEEGITVASKPPEGL